MKLSEIRKLTRGFPQMPDRSDPRLAQFLYQQLGLEPGKLYQELEMDSLYVDTHRDITFSNSQLFLHSHAFYEVLYCRSCQGVEYLMGSDRYRLQPGDVIMVPPGVSHRPILPEKMEEPYVRDVLWISREFAQLIEARFPDDSVDQRDHSTPIRTGGTRWESIGSLFRTGVKEAETGAPGWEMAVIGNTMLIMSQLKRAYIERSAGMLKTEKRELLDELTAYIETHYSQTLTLGELARRFYVSESTVSHLFKQKMGVSLHRYVTQRRLIAAKNRILEGAALEAVAEQVGFSDYSAFYRAFKGAYGISPKEFRSQSTEHAL